MRVITWNSCGARLRALEDRLRNYQPHIMVVQECGNLPNEMGHGNLDTQQIWQLDDLAGYHCFWCGWDRQGGGGNPRCSLAMFYQDIGSPIAILATDQMKRPVMRKQIGHYLIYNIHAGGLDYINQVFQSARTWAAGGSCVIIGDFNQDPPTINHQILPYYPNFFITAPNQATRPASGRILDYAVSDQHGAVTLPTYYGGSDHRSVIIDFP